MEPSFFALSADDTLGPAQPLFSAHGVNVNIGRKGDVVLTEEERRELQAINREWLDNALLPALEAGAAGRG